MAGTNRVHHERLRALIVEIARAEGDEGLARINQQADKLASEIGSPELDREDAIEILAGIGVLMAESRPYAIEVAGAGEYVVRFARAGVTLMLRRPSPTMQAVQVFYGPRFACALRLDDIREGHALRIDGSAYLRFKRSVFQVGRAAVLDAFERVCALERRRDLARAGGL